jgi:hypothetical protein
MNEMTCQSCDKPKQSLKRVASKLIPGLSVIMCKSCIDSSYEPRFIIILAYNQENNAVKRYITEHRYHGAEIELRDVVN